MSNPAQILATIERGRSVSLDLGSFRGQWDFFQQEGQSSGIENLQQFMQLLERRADEMQHIRRLSLSGNELTEVPRFVTKLAALERLDLSDNRIESLGDRLFGLERLHWLNLRANLLREVPPELEELAALEDLILRKCTDLEVLPDFLARMPALRRIDILPEARADHAYLSITFR